MSLSERLTRCYSGAVYDTLRALGHGDCVLPSNIRPIDPARRLAGRVFTVSGRPGRYDDRETLLQWTRLLSKAPADSVVICQPNDNTMALMGELSSETLKIRGIRGYIVDGGCRDTEFIHGIGFPVFCKFYTPLDIVGRWIADSLGDPIQIGSVKIHTGDYVVADVDGIVVIPGSVAEQVADEAERVMRTESLVRKAILSGVDPEEAYLKYGKF
jgi:4-hydroxy-4-methyl-2-oxoglutarate aldolase